MDQQPPQESGQGARPNQKKESQQQQAQASGRPQQTNVSSTGQQAQGTRAGQQQAQGTRTGQQAQGTRTGQQAQGIRTAQQEKQGRCIRKQRAQVAAAEKVGRQSARDLYPDLHIKTYFIPPQHFNKVPYDVQTVAGKSVLVPQKAPDQPGQAPAYFPPTGPPPHPSDPPLAAVIWPAYQTVPPGPLPMVYDNDVRDGHATQQVLDCIRVLAEREHEVMLVLSQLEFRRYLDKRADPIYAAAIRLLLQPDTLGASYTDWEFDVLMISARYGLIVGEIKSVGADLSKTPDLGMAVLKAVEKAINQLNKAENVLKHLVSDLEGINITKTLMLPNVTSTQLLQALSTDPQVQQALCDCLGAPDINIAVTRCLCQDHMGPSSSGWWQRAVTDKGPDTSMTPDLYEVLVARFCGPASTIEIPTITAPRRTVQLRTMSEAVALTGLTMSMLTLYPDQVHLVNRPGLPRVFLWGPPGTGKTVVLVIKGMQWGHQGKDVHLLSSHRHSRAAILLIERQLLHAPGIGFTATSASGTLVQTATSASGILGTSTPGPRVYTHLYDFEHNEGDVEAAVRKLASAARDGELFVIADEAFSGRDDSRPGGVDTSGRFAAFCNHLATRVPALHLWAAAVERDVTPACLREERVTTPVRCPPAVLRHVRGSGWIDGLRVPRYSSSAAPAPTDGPKVRVIQHWERRSLSTPLPGHTAGWPENCGGCADRIASLMEELRVGQSGRDLQYRDTIILCRDPRDDLPVVTRLRARDLPVQVVTSRDDEAAIRNVALAVRDAVTVTDYNVVRGLERRVVVVLGWGRFGFDVDDYRDKLLAMSRCTALLVWSGDGVDDDDYKDRLHAISRSTALLVWAGEPL